MTPEEIQIRERDKVSLLVDACNIASKHYEDYSKAFANLDTKASTIATISGIVLAAVVAFFKGGRVPAITHECWVYMMISIAAPILALIAIICSLFGAKVTEVLEPFDSPERMREAKNLANLSTDELSRQHIIDYYRAQLDYWSQAIEDIKKVVRGKAARVLCGQYFLIASLVFLTALFLVILLTSSHAG
jgi:hypothetical protein